MSCKWLSITANKLGLVDLATSSCTLLPSVSLYKLHSMLPRL